MSDTTNAVEVNPSVILSNGDRYERKNHLPVCDHPLLSVKNLSYAYPDGTKVLHDISFDICDIPNHGQVVSFLGPSGAGKSTLMNIITGTIEEGYYGSVQVYDDVLQKQVDVRSGMVGKVTQDYWFAPFCTVEQNLMIAVSKKRVDGVSTPKSWLDKLLEKLGIRTTGGLSEEEQKRLVNEMLERFGMSKFRDRYRLQLSGGQKQRIAIIQQWLCSDHYIVLDEPFTSLDPIMKNDLVKLINEMSELDEHNTIIIVTHDIRQAIACSDTIYLMGRDYDDADQPIPGAEIKLTYDLNLMGLAYQPNIKQLPAYAELTSDLDARFPTL